MTTTRRAAGEGPQSTLCPNTNFLAKLADRRAGDLPPPRLTQLSLLMMTRAAPAMPRARRRLEQQPEPTPNRTGTRVREGVSGRGTRVL